MQMNHFTILTMHHLVVNFSISWCGEGWRRSVNISLFPTIVVFLNKKTCRSKAGNMRHAFYKNITWEIK